MPRTVAGEPVRILYCESNIDDTVGGSHFCLLHLVERLDRRRFAPVTLFYRDHVLVPRFRQASQTIVLATPTPMQWGTDLRATMIAVPLALARRAVNLGRWALAVARHVRLLQRERISLVHLNNSITRHHDMMLAALLAGVPVLTSERGINPFYSATDRWFARRLGLIVPVSHGVGAHLVAHGISADNLRVIYDGFDADALTFTETDERLRAEWDVRPDQPVIGMVGNVREWKGQEVVIRALIEIVRTHPDLVCFFVGSSSPEDQPYLDRLHRLLAEAGIERNVRFTGFRRNVADYIKLMQFVVHASTLPEPFGMVALEAMAQRKAMIASNTGGITEIVVDGETGFTFTAGDPRALAVRIGRLLDDPALAVAMGQRAFERLRTVFSMDQTVGDVQAVYDAMLAGAVVPASIGQPVAGASA